MKKYILAAALVLVATSTSAGVMNQRLADILDSQIAMENIPKHMVSIPGYNYELGKYEVTQMEWKAVMGSNPSGFGSCGGYCPVERVSWDDIQTFLQKLNEMTGRQYRLPTEAEWQYACYGGSKTEYCGGNDLDAVGWYDQNSGSKTHRVGQKQANGYGLYDMSGNVWEWVQDKVDNGHVVRGGAMNYDSHGARSAYSTHLTSSSQGGDVGFRLARTLP